MNFETLPHANAPSLRSFLAAATVLAEHSPRNLTLAQCVFFLHAGLADLVGRAATFTEIKEAVGPAVNRSLHTTYKAFLKEGRLRDGERSEGLGWLNTQTDPRDNRRKYLILTPEGRHILKEVMAAVDSPSS